MNPKEEKLIYSYIHIIVKQQNWGKKILRAMRGKDDLQWNKNWTQNKLLNSN